MDSKQWGIFGHGCDDKRSYSSYLPMFHEDWWYHKESARRWHQGIFYFQEIVPLNKRCYGWIWFCRSSSKRLFCDLDMAKLEFFHFFAKDSSQSASCIMDDITDGVVNDSIADVNRAHNRKHSGWWVKQMKQLQQERVIPINGPYRKHRSTSAWNLSNESP